MFLSRGALQSTLNVVKHILSVDICSSYYKLRGHFQIVLQSSSTIGISGWKKCVTNSLNGYTVCYATL
jgi:NAD(P)H-hydrate repair Nnr-like enzyme with NAD(P)H-hydrate epimerase domain